MGQSGPKNMSTLTSGQKAISGDLAGYFHNNFQNGATPYMGSAYPMFHANQQLPIWDQIQSLITSHSKQTPLQALDKQGQGAINDLLTAGPADLTDWFNHSVKAPMMQSFKQDILPQINESFANVGAFSSRRGAATAQAASNLSTQMGSALSNMSLQDYENSFTRKAQGVGLQMNAAQLQNQLNMAPDQMNLQRAQQLFGVGSALQGRADQNNLQGYNSQLGGFNFDFNNFLRTAPENNPYIQQMLSFVGQHQTTPYMPTSGSLGGTLGGALGGAMAGNTIFPGLGGLLGGLGGAAVGFFG